MARLSIPTPSLDHLSSDDFEHIYSPSEDSFLMIDAFEEDLKTILDSEPSVCLEIGVGSGVVITALASVLGDVCRYYGTDINPVACRKAEETGACNNVTLRTFCCDLVEGIPEDLKGTIDILIFNPPYVVTESDEVASGHLACTWAGGKKGREVMDRLFPQLPSLLSAKGVFYLLLDKPNNPEEVKQVLGELGFTHCCILKRKNMSESLCVVKFSRKC